MNEQRIQEIKDNLKKLMEKMVSIGTEPPPEVKQLLMQVFAKAKRQIQDLRAQDEALASQQRQPPGTPSPPPLSNEVQLLWVLAGQQEQAFISYLRTFPSAETTALLNNPLEMSRVIEQLTQQMPPGEQPVVDGIQHSDLNSSNVWGIAYDPRTSKMKVRFQGGSVYEYDGVPANIYRAVAKGNAAAKTTGQNEFGRWWKFKQPSAGAAMHQYVKSAGFPYRRIR